MAALLLFLLNTIIIGYSTDIDIRISDIKLTRNEINEYYCPPLVINSLSIQEQASALCRSHKVCWPFFYIY